MSSDGRVYPEARTEAQEPRDSNPRGTFLEQAGRQSGKDALLRKIIKLRDEAASLDTIHKMLPSTPTPEQDQAIWDLVNKLG